MPMYQCDHDDPCVDASSCSGHGICNNGTGACDCDAGFTGATSYFTYRDCHVDLTLHTAFTTVTLVLASTALGLACMLLFARACSTAVACGAGRGRRKGQLTERQLRMKRLLLGIYLRVCVASVVSMAYESMVLAAGAGGLRIYELPGAAGLLRSMFPWLIIGNSAYIVDIVINLIPLSFLRTNSRNNYNKMMMKKSPIRDVAADSGTGDRSGGDHNRDRSLGSSIRATFDSLSSVDFEALRNRSLKVFAKHYWKYDVVLFVMFLWQAVAMQFPSVGQCWLPSVLEITIGAACLPVVMLANSSISILLDMIAAIKKKEKEGEDAAGGLCCERCCRCVWIGIGPGVIRRLYCTTYSSSNASSSAEGRSKAAAQRAALFRLRLIQSASTGAAWGAFIVCLLIGLVDTLQRNPSIFVSCTMWFAHLFNFVALLGIAGTDCPCGCSGGGGGGGSKSPSTSAAAFASTSSTPLSSERAGRGGVELNTNPMLTAAAAKTKTAKTKTEVKTMQN